MFLKRIRLTNYRNYLHKEFHFTDNGALIIGDNGCGKTNLFEAITYLGLGKSIRQHTDDKVLTTNKEYFHLNADMDINTSSFNFDFRYVNNKKYLQINDNPIKLLSQLFDIVKITYCSPDDVALINGNPKIRRHYFDLAISQLHPCYIDCLRKYLHIISQRNILLKNRSNLSQKPAWDDQFIDTAIDVIKYRLDYLNEFNTWVKNNYQDISLHENVSVSYLPSINTSLDLIDSDELRKQLKLIEEREFIAQRTLIGPHLDDYQINYKETDLRFYGSQGQKRATVLLMKIAHSDLIYHKFKSKPILLFDDIFSELDNRFLQEIKSMLNLEYQVFIASPHEGITKNWKHLPVIRIK